ncbi:MAG: hypothetical protein A2Y12_11050 [Planctomycetes bacterium GWF2_42_9]|nr:MAG: hypothetical protein A2Y12_11050 [Planctomycetes bacterium GWF2_42_9]HAL45280.1 hypothetical protein [Phycisphaerales bacterium]
MRLITFEIEEKVRLLISILDSDIQNILNNLSRLNELRGFVIKKDEASLQMLLGTIQMESSSYKENEFARHQVRQELAQIWGCTFEEMTLTKLESELSGEIRNEVVQKKWQLKTLTSKFKLEYANTLKLLTNCARFNKMLLKSILAIGNKNTVTYGPTGRTELADSTFMNAQF